MESNNQDRLPHHEDDQLIKDFSKDQPAQEELYREYQKFSESENNSQSD